MTGRDLNVLHRPGSRNLQQPHPLTTSFRASSSGASPPPMLSRHSSPSPWESGGHNLNAEFNQLGMLYTGASAEVGSFLPHSLSTERDLDVLHAPYTQQDMNRLLQMCTDNSVGLKVSAVPSEATRSREFLQLDEAGDARFHQHLKTWYEAGNRNESTPSYLLSPFQVDGKDWVLLVIKTEPEMAPTFVYYDPSGVREIPARLIRRVSRILPISTYQFQLVPWPRLPFPSYREGSWVSSVLVAYAAHLVVEAGVTPNHFPFPSDDGFVPSLDLDQLRQHQALALALWEDPEMAYDEKGPVPPSSDGAVSDPLLLVDADSDGPEGATIPNKRCRSRTDNDAGHGAGKRVCRAGEIGNEDDNVASTGDAVDGKFLKERNAVIQQAKINSTTAKKFENLLKVWLLLQKKLEQCSPSSKTIELKSVLNELLNSTATSSEQSARALWIHDNHTTIFSFVWKKNGDKGDCNLCVASAGRGIDLTRSLIRPCSHLALDHGDFFEIRSADGSSKTFRTVEDVKALAAVHIATEDIDKKNVIMNIEQISQIVANAVDAAGLKLLSSQVSAGVDAAKLMLGDYQRYKDRVLDASLIETNSVPFAHEALEWKLKARIDQLRQTLRETRLQPEVYANPDKSKSLLSLIVDSMLTWKDEIRRWMREEPPSFTFDVLQMLKRPLPHTTVTIADLALLLGCDAVNKRLKRWQDFCASMNNLLDYLHTRSRSLSENDIDVIKTFTRLVNAIPDPAKEEDQIAPLPEDEAGVQDAGLGFPSDSVHLETVAWLALNCLCSNQPRTLSSDEECKDNSDSFEHAAEETHAWEEDPLEDRETEERCTKFEILIIDHIICEPKYSPNREKILYKPHPITGEHLLYTTASNGKLLLLVEFAQRYRTVFIAEINKPLACYWNATNVCTRRATDSGLRTSGRFFDVVQFIVGQLITAQKSDPSVGLRSAPDHPHTALSIALALPPTIKQSGMAPASPEAEPELRTRKRLVEMLIEAGESPDLIACDGVIPLHMAISSRDAELVKVLAPKVKNINLADREGKTAIWIAAASGQWDLVRWLLKNHPSINLLLLNDTYKTISKRCLDIKLYKMAAQLRRLMKDNLLSSFW